MCLIEATSDSETELQLGALIFPPDVDIWQVWWESPRAQQMQALGPIESNNRLPDCTPYEETRRYTIPKYLL